MEWQPVLSYLLKLIKLRIIMKTLKLEDSTARDIYKTADSSLKTILEESFGKEFFKLDIKDRINTFEDVCDELNIRRSSDMYSRAFVNLPVWQQESAILEYQIKSIVYLANRGKSFGAYKYYTYRYKGGSAWVLDCLVADCSSDAGSSFYYTSKEDCIFWTNKFSEIYHKYL